MVQEGITVTVKDKEQVDWIRDKVRRGNFASETEVVAHSIAVLREKTPNWSVGCTT